ncbi:siderophore-interacting protein [Chryseobacterium phosphatilyticum]|uniref:Siderophore-interacting protein n=2 Tax=Chryseobacterium phosphatilyticum TaxID=475075 RepID=A0A316XEY9_9FLAO|nr:siderophore-interacting protein [Chryseobacterium phosphatilyticum]
MTHLMKPKKIRSEFIVKNKEFLTPHLIRVVFDINENQAELLKQVQSGSNNKIFIPAGEMRGEPLVRTYTNRKIDLENLELTIDFVYHGESGPASAWALQVNVGDSLEIGMKESTRALVPDADFYLFVGDATALPVICSIVEQLPSYVKAKVLLEVHGKEDELILCSAADITVEWLHNLQPEKGSRLSERTKQFEFPKGILKEYVYVAGEYTTVRDLRSYFKTTLQWDLHGLYACSYWRAGQSEDEHPTKTDNNG